MYQVPTDTSRSPFRSPRQMVLWVLLTTVAGVIGSVMAFELELSRRQMRAGLLPSASDAAMDGFLGGGIVGALVGLAQLAVLFPALANVVHWLAASLGGHAAGIYLARYITWGHPGWAALLLSGFIAGIVAGTAQLPALRTLRLGSWWLLASAVGSALNWAVMALVLGPLRDGPTVSDRLVSWGAGWFVYALATALVLYLRAGEAAASAGAGSSGA